MLYVEENTISTGSMLLSKGETKQPATQHIGEVHVYCTGTRLGHRPFSVLQKAIAETPGGYFKEL